MNRTQDVYQANREWIRPSPAREKAWKIAAWVMLIIGTMFFIWCGVFVLFLTGDAEANPKAVVFFLMPVVFWLLLRMDDESPITGVRIAQGDELQVEMDSGRTYSISYEKLVAHRSQIARLRENGQYYLPRTDGFYIRWRGGPELSRHEIRRIGVRKYLENQAGKTVRLHDGNQERK